MLVTKSLESVGLAENGDVLLPATSSTKTYATRYGFRTAIFELTSAM